ncbi:uncharacterized protein isoform X2 [Danio rerio]|uniref:Uncharacterized protein isoform X2 n=1 Tax=Danio rerio TaxID=7955 RepID=A0AC58JDI8_DANRE
MEGKCHTCPQNPLLTRSFCMFSGKATRRKRRIWRGTAIHASGWGQTEGKVQRRRQEGIRSHIDAMPNRRDELSSSPNTRHQWRLYGYLIAYLVSITGHRPGVFQNLLIQEVVSARRSSDGLSFVINAETHKTNQTYGAAQLAVTSEEYEWFNRFLEVRSSLPGGNAARYFFFTSRPASCKNLNQYFQIAWAEMKLPGCPTFTDVRSSIATHIKHAHTGDLRAKLSDFMAHDTGTSDRYYAMNLTASQAMSYRHWFEQALCASPGDNQTDGRPPSVKKSGQAQQPSKPAILQLQTA